MSAKNNTRHLREILRSLTIHRRYIIKRARKGEITPAEKRAQLADIDEQMDKCAQRIGEIVSRRVNRP